MLVHGLGSSQNYYASVIPALNAQKIRCIALDTTGQDRSPYTGVEQSVHSLATDIIDAMDALGVQKAVVVGHSMAGITVPHLAATWPDRVAAAILLEPVLPSKESVPTFKKRIKTVEKGGMEPMADTIPYGAVGSSARPLHHAFIRELLLAHDPNGYLSMCRAIIASTGNPPEYKKVKCPVFVIAGSEDKSAPVEMCQNVLGLIGAEEKRIVFLKGIGHWMCVEAPDDVSKEMVEILRVGVVSKKRQTCPSER